VNCGKMPQPLPDDSPEEEMTYDERCAQIAREMMYLMSRVEL